MHFSLFLVLLDYGCSGTTVVIFPCVSLHFVATLRQRLDGPPQDAGRDAQYLKDCSLFKITVTLLGHTFWKRESAGRCTGTYDGACNKEQTMWLVGDHA
jgi:hypothetical protein